MGRSLRACVARKSKKKKCLTVSMISLVPLCIGSRTARSMSIRTPSRHPRWHSFSTCGLRGRYIPHVKFSNIAISTCSNAMSFIGGMNEAVFSVIGDFWWEAEKVDSSGVGRQKKRAPSERRHARRDLLTSDRAARHPRSHETEAYA